MSIAEIMAEMREKGLMKQAAAQPPVQAAPVVESDDLAKLAEDIYLSGRIAGIGWFDSLMAKIADEAVPARGLANPSAADTQHDAGSLMSKLTKKLETFHGGQQPGGAPKVPAGSKDTGQVLAENVAPNQVNNPNPANKG